MITDFKLESKDFLEKAKEYNFENKLKTKYDFNSLEIYESLGPVGVHPSDINLGDLNKSEWKNIHNNIGTYECVSRLIEGIYDFDTVFDILANEIVSSLNNLPIVYKDVSIFLFAYQESSISAGTLVVDQDFNEKILDTERKRTLLRYGLMVK